MDSAPAGLSSGDETWNGFSEVESDTGNHADFCGDIVREVEHDVGEMSCELNLDGLEHDVDINHELDNLNDFDETDLHNRHADAESNQYSFQCEVPAR